MSGMRALALGLGVLLGLAAPVWAQPPAGEAQASFGEAIDVRVVNVEAVVMGRDGRRVQGLGQRDFRLLVDGKPVAIDYFSEVDDGAVREPEAAAPAEGAERSLGLGPVATSYLVFIDDFFGVERRRNEVIRSLAETVARLGPNDRMAIVAYDGRQLDTLAEWTGSAEVLRGALAQAEKRRAFGLDRVLEARRHFETEAFAKNAARLAEAEDETQSPWLNLRQVWYAELLVNQLKREVTGITATLRAFAAPEGR